jgi:hypothetical protein
MFLNYKELIDNNVAEMLKRHSPGKAETASASSTAAPSGSKPASVAASAPKQSFLTRLWKSIFK